MRPPPPPPSDIIGLSGLAFLAGSPTDFERFLGVSGLAAEDLRARAGEPQVLAGVLDFLLGSDLLLLAFCEAESLDPRDVHRAAADLSGRQP
jgi:hypothetical protein